MSHPVLAAPPAKISRSKRFTLFLTRLTHSLALPKDRTWKNQKLFGKALITTNPDARDTPLA